ncbi:hypothetical protein EG835_00100 [bacterium]|nr:hypothetical protein [bacterium]
MAESHTETDTAAGVSRRGCFGVVGGIVLVLVGIPMLVCPGPGVVTILAGFGMIGAGLGLKRRDRSSDADAGPE